MDDFNPKPAGNPYATPSPNQPNKGGGNTGKIKAPAIALIVVGSLGVLASLFAVVSALFIEPQIDPNAPEWLQEFQRGGAGPMAAVIQVVFVLVNGFIIFGGVSMLRLSGWGLALAASIVAMLNCGSLCCILGLPVGIWSLVILLQDDVKQIMR